jgi:hypothetical protein
LADGSIGPICGVAAIGAFPVPDVTAVRAESRAVNGLDGPFCAAQSGHAGCGAKPRRLVGS